MGIIKFIGSQNLNMKNTWFLKHYRYENQARTIDVTRKTDYSFQEHEFA